MKFVNMPSTHTSIDICVSVERLSEFDAADDPDEQQISTAMVTATSGLPNWANSYIDLEPSSNE